MQMLRERHCRLLISTDYEAVGIAREGKRWHLVFARPLLSAELGDWEEAGREVLAHVNRARSQSRRCGSRTFAAAEPLSWNRQLAAAALAHSRDMAEYRYLDHKGRDGSDAAQRVGRQGYRWKRIGENVATGQGSVPQVVAGWLESPGHCANVMNPEFTQMGAAYALNPDSDTTIYWTQVFGTPR